MDVREGFRREAENGWRVRPGSASLGSSSEPCDICRRPKPGPRWQAWLVSVVEGEPAEPIAACADCHRYACEPGPKVARQAPAAAPRSWWSVGIVLLRQGEITEEQLRAAYDTQDQTGCRFADALRAVGVPDDVIDAAWDEVRER